MHCCAWILNIYFHGTSEPEHVKSGPRRVRRTQIRVLVCTQVSPSFCSYKLSVNYFKSYMTKIDFFQSAQGKSNQNLVRSEHDNLN